MNHSKRRTNATVRNRTKEIKQLWGQLKPSTAPIDQKAKSALSVAWPRLFHGVSTVNLSPAVIKEPRAGLMKGLNLHHGGTSSTVHLGMVARPILDPAFYVLKDTVMQFRKYAAPEVAYPILDDFSTEPPDRYHPGPCGLLLGRLHGIGWHWDGSGTIVDHERLTHAMDQVTDQLLPLRLRQAWWLRKRVNACRPLFERLCRADVRRTLVNWDKWTPEEQGILRAARTGTLYIRDKHYKAKLPPDPDCQWYGQPDSILHRNWECPAFEPQRQGPTPEIRHQIPRLPACSSHHGWIQEAPALRPWRKALVQLPDRTGVHLDLAEPSGTCLHLFVDGACDLPKEPGTRIASWAVVYADANMEHFLPVSSGIVPGLLQTSGRAELHATISALQYGLRQRIPFCI